MWWMVLACGGGWQGRTDAGGRVWGEDTDEAVGTDAEAPLDTAQLGGRCPEGMVEVVGFCIDRFEATLEEWVDGAWRASSPYEEVDERTVRAAPGEGLVPQAYLSGDEASAACVAADKRLCSSEEWTLACRGPDGWTWPYGDEYVAGACNDAYAGGHPVTDYFGTSSGVWDTEHMNDPGINQQSGTVAAGGAFTACVSSFGVHDLHGNLHEWVDDADGTFRGGFYADGSINGDGCGYVTTAHSRSYHDYSTGFRCCAELDAR